jgi:hypothetical protein
MTRHAGGSDSIQELLAAAGQPVAGHTLSVPEMRQAVDEGRVLQVLYWSTFGEGEASFAFARDFGVDADGRVHPAYLVFPRPIPPPLRRPGESRWQKADEVFAAFGVAGE